MSLLLEKQSRGEIIMWLAPICCFLDFVGIKVQDLVSLYCIVVLFFIFIYVVDEQLPMKRKPQPTSSDEIIVDVEEEPHTCVEIARVAEHRPRFAQPAASFRLSPTANQVEALVMDALFGGERTLRRRRARLTFMKGFREVSKALHPKQHSKQAFCDESTFNSSFCDGASKKQRLLGRLRTGITKRSRRKRNETLAPTCQLPILEHISF